MSTMSKFEKSTTKGTWISGFRSAGGEIGF